VNITIFEAHPENYQYIIKNAKNTNNIAFFNKAIVGDETKELSIQWQAFHMSFSPENKNKISKEYVIPTENFFALLKSQKYDWLKMDIEWWEYNCLYPLIDKNIGLEWITWWFIEFHPLKNMDKIKQTKEIITHLQKYYSIDLCDSVSNKVIFLEDIWSYDVIYIAFKNHS